MTEVWVATWEVATGSIEGEVGAVISAHASLSGAVAAAQKTAAEWAHGSVVVVTMPALVDEETGELERVVYTKEFDPKDPDTWSYDEDEEWDVCHDVTRWEVQP